MEHRRRDGGGTDAVGRVVRLKERAGAASTQEFRADRPRSLGHPHPASRDSSPAARNLIENAIKYAGASEVRIVPGAGAVSIIVADRGPGVPPERIADVFAPFTRLESARNRDTGGIGLASLLARAIVRVAK